MKVVNVKVSAEIDLNYSTLQNLSLNGLKRYNNFVTFKFTTFGITLFSNFLNCAGLKSTCPKYLLNVLHVLSRVLQIPPISAYNIDSVTTVHDVDPQIPLDREKARQYHFIVHHGRLVVNCLGF